MNDLDSPVAGSYEIAVGSLKCHGVGIEAEKTDHSREAGYIGDWFH